MILSQFIPKGLIAVCRHRVELCHKQDRSLKLPKIFTDDKDTMVFILVHEDTRTLSGAAWAFFKLGIFWFIMFILLTACSYIFYWWIGLGALSAFVGSIYCLKRAKAMNISIASLILALEVMSNDVGEVSTYLPGVYQQAKICVE